MRFFLSGPRILGIRPGVVFSGQDVARLLSRSKPQVRLEQTDADGFVYAITNPSGQVKIGVSVDPLARLAQLQTGSHVPLTLAYAGISPSTGYDIEARTHEILGRHRMHGEWFDIPLAVAVAAISGAAEELKIPLLRVDPSLIAKGLAIVKGDGDATTKPRRDWSDWFLIIVKNIIAFIVLAAIVLIVLFFGLLVYYAFNPTK